AGAGIVKDGLHVFISDSIKKTVPFIFVSPAVDLVLVFIVMLAMLWIFRKTRPSRVDGGFRKMQLVSAAAYSLGHGGNDAQKTMGIIAALLVGAHYLHLKPNGDYPIQLWI